MQNLTILYTFTCSVCKRAVTLYKLKGRCGFCKKEYDLTENVKNMLDKLFNL